MRTSPGARALKRARPVKCPSAARVGIRRGVSRSGRRPAAPAMPIAAKRSCELPRPG